MKCPICDNQMILCWKFSAQAWYCPKCDVTFRGGIWWIDTKKLQDKETNK